MLSITQPELTPEILNLFDLGRPTMPRAFNVLEGFIKGQILYAGLSSLTMSHGCISQIVSTNVRLSSQG